MNPNIETIMNEYDSVINLYKDLTEKLRVLVSVILDDQGVPVHSVTARWKTRDSLKRKLLRPDSGYSTLSDITDVAGVRVTTFFSDDVDRVAEILEREFDIDWPNSIDKRAALDPDRFGYLSLHHVVSFSPERCSLAEYKQFHNATICRD